MYNPVDIDLMRLETERRAAELAPLAHRAQARRAADRREERRARRLPVVPGRLGPAIAALLQRPSSPPHRTA